MNHPIESMFEWAPLASEAEIELKSKNHKRFVIFIQFPFVILLSVVGAVHYFGLVDFELLFWKFVGAISCVNGGSALGFQMLLYGSILVPFLAMWLCMVRHRTKSDISIIKAKQNPVPGEKVFEPTKVKKGLQVCIVPALALFLVWIVLPLTVVNMLMFTKEMVGGDIASETMIAMWG